jgi:hypothetical protein
MIGNLMLDESKSDRSGNMIEGKRREPIQLSPEVKKKKELFNIKKRLNKNRHLTQLST